MKHSEISQACFNSVADAIVNVNSNYTAYWNDDYDKLTINDGQIILTSSVITELLFDNKFNYKSVANIISQKLMFD